MEIWKAVPGQSGYEVSDLGRTRSWIGKGATQYRKSRITPLILKPNLNPVRKRRYVTLTHRKTFYVCHLVLRTFVGPCPKGMEACHRNGKSFDDRLENLRWDTRSSNIADKFLHGTQPEGERHGRAKLTEMDVLQIRSEYEAGDSLVKLGTRYGVSDVVIGNIVTGKNWKRVGGPTHKAGEHFGKRTYDKSGEGNPFAKLNWKKVTALSNGTDASKLAKKYDVARITIYHIKNRRIWNHGADH
jgi:Mor family transcriptional regulator